MIATWLWFFQKLKTINYLKTQFWKYCFYIKTYKVWRITFWKYSYNRLSIGYVKKVLLTLTLQSNFIEITLRHGCSRVNLLHIFRAPFLKNTYGRLLLKISINLQMVSEVAVYRCSINPVFSKIPKNLHKNTCLGVSFSIKLQASPPQNTSRRLFQMVYWTQCT